MAPLSRLLRVVALAGLMFVPAPVVGQATPAAPTMLVYRVANLSQAARAGTAPIYRLSGTEGVRAAPGDTLEYQMVLTNARSTALHQVVLDAPLGGGIHYLGGSQQSLQPARVLFSIDGGRSYAATPTVTVKDADGRSRAVPAAPASYTHVRWVLTAPVPAGATAQVSYQTQVGMTK